MAAITQWLLEHQDLDKRLITAGIECVDTAPDLSNCKVHIYHPQACEQMEKRLNAQSHPLHQHLFKNIEIRRVPKIRFITRSDLSKEKKLESILNDIDEQHA